MDLRSFFFTLVFSYLVIPLTLSYIFISYIKSLEYKKCSCSNDIRRKYVKFYGYFLFVFSFIGLIIISYSIRNPKMLLLNNFLKIFAIIINVLGAYILNDYDKILDNSNCNCADSWKKVFMKYYAYYIISITGLIFFMLLIMFILHILNEEDKYILNIKNIFNDCH